MARLFLQKGMKGVQTNGGGTWGFLGAVIGMGSGVVEIHSLASALIISGLCTVSGFFINKALKWAFDGKSKKRAG